MFILLNYKQMNRNKFNKFDFLFINKKVINFVLLLGYLILYKIN